MVWDTIYARDPGRQAPVEEWGGISYALSAFEAVALEEWTLFPIIKVGADLRHKADELLSRLERIDSVEGVRTVPEPNNRVELRYEDAARRCERLTGGVPGWTWEELAPLAQSCDAVYVNFIAGWELDLVCARRLRAEFDGPLYSDIHSLLLGTGPDGARRLRRPEAWREWLACFDIVQINSDELDVLAEDWGDPWKLAADVVGPTTRALLVTLGERGAAWVATADFWRLGEEGHVRDPWGRRHPTSGVHRVPSTVVSGKVDASHRVQGGDPTGCGDVWGITCFASLLGGMELEAAMRRANGFAARNAAYRGASGLASALQSASGIVLDG